MISFPVTFKKNKKAALLEQAAGFPPFTRGYLTIATPVKIGEKLTADFTLANFSDSNIIDLFSQIILREAKGNISLSLPFVGTINEVIYIRLLRTLLAFVSEKLYNNAAIVQFEFYGDYSSEMVSLNTLMYANMAQIDVLFVEHTNDWEVIKKILPQAPIDNLFGADYLEKKTSTIFFSLWEQIKYLLE